MMKEVEKRMSIWEILLIGLGLSMDAAAVSMGNGLACQGMERKKVLSIPIFFGVFQAGMPILGYFAGGLFAGWIERFAGTLTFIILGFIGGKMIYDGFHMDQEAVSCKALTYRMILVQAVATSIDAFAVGVSFSAMKVQVFVAAGIIGITTFICSLASLYIGKKFGMMLGSKAQILGGIILFAMGIKALLG